jgi:hypothetical protein
MYRQAFMINIPFEFRFIYFTEVVECLKCNSLQHVFLLAFQMIPYANKQRYFMWQA